MTKSNSNNNNNKATTTTSSSSSTSTPTASSLIPLPRRFVIHLPLPLLLILLLVLQVFVVPVDGNNRNNTDSSSSLTTTAATAATVTTDTTMSSSSNNDDNSNDDDQTPLLLSDLELKLRKEFGVSSDNGVIYNATDDEIIRFTKSAQLTTYGNGNKQTQRTMNDKDVAKVVKLATERLEEYFDWRQSFGLDYDDATRNNQNDKQNDDDEVYDDASIWKWAVERAVSVEELHKKAKKRHNNAVDSSSPTATASSVVSGWFGFGGGGSKPKATETKTESGGLLNVDGVKNSPGTVDYDAAIAKASSQDDDEDAAVDEDEKGENHNNNNNNSKQQKDGGNNNGPPPILPQIIFQPSVTTTTTTSDDDVIHLLRDVNGVPILQVFAAKIDRTAGSAETWALAVALYLERLFDRSPSSVTLQRMEEKNQQNNHQAKASDGGGDGTAVNDGTCPNNNDGDKTNKRKKKRPEVGNVTLLVDLRGGQHWPNPKAIMMINLIRKIVHSISTYHPGRITSMIMYPLPRALLGVWNSVSGYFGPDVVESFHLIPGPSKPGSPVPKLELQQFIDGDVVDRTEQRRNELDVAE